MGQLHQARVVQAAARRAKGSIIGPRSVKIFLAAAAQFQCADIGQGITDKVRREHEQPHILPQLGTLRQRFRALARVNGGLIDD